MRNRKREGEGERADNENHGQRRVAQLGYPDFRFQLRDCDYGISLIESRSIRLK